MVVQAEEEELLALEDRGGQSVVMGGRGTSRMVEWEVLRRTS